MSKYRFDQIAINSTAKKKPTEEDKYHYIGLEHLDSQNLIVSRWGSEVAPKGEKLLMKKGDVLFGKRRAYQRKVAIAPFDGIFSAHGMVLRPNEEVVDKDFFPMFISSDYFLDAAIAISVGSLSPTINWKDLARLEFDLPPIEEQRKLAEVLWSINDTLQAYQKLLTETDALVQAQFIEMFGDPIIAEADTSLSELGTACMLKAGKFVKADDIKEIPSNDMYPCYGGNGLRGYVFNYNCEGEYPLIGRQGALCGNVQYASGKFYATEHAVVVTPKQEMDTYWLFHLLTLLNLNRYASGAAQPGLAVNKLEAIRIYIPPVEEQIEFSKIAKQTDKSKNTLQNTITSLHATKRCILEDSLGNGRKE